MAPRRRVPRKECLCSQGQEGVRDTGHQRTGGCGSCGEDTGRDRSPSLSSAGHSVPGAWRQTHVSLSRVSKEPKHKLECVVETSGARLSPQGLRAVTALLRGSADPLEEADRSLQGDTPTSADWCSVSSLHSWGFSVLCLFWNSSRSQESPPSWSCSAPHHQLHSYRLPGREPC